MDCWERGPNQSPNNLVLQEYLISTRLYPSKKKVRKPPDGDNGNSFQPPKANGSANGGVYTSESAAVGGKGLISELPESYNRDYYKAYKKFMKSNEVSPIGGTETMDGFMVSV
eukprot:sb/3476970/